MAIFYQQKLFKNMTLAKEIIEYYTAIEETLGMTS